jgi:hypothetical protein
MKLLVRPFHADLLETDSIHASVSAHKESTTKQPEYPMKLIVRPLHSDLLEIDWDPSTGEKGLKNCIQSFDSTWTHGRQRLCRLEPKNIPFSVDDLSEGDWLGLFLCPPRFVKFTASYSHTLFGMHLSSSEDFSYPNTTSVFFEFDQRQGVDSFQCFTTRKTFATLTDLIQSITYLPDEMKPYWIELAIPAWEDVMQTWPALHQAYLDRRLRVEEGIH